MSIVAHPAASDEQSEAELAERRCHEQALLDKYPGFVDQSDDYLIELVADPLPFSDVDDHVAAAVIILERRASGQWPRVHGRTEPAAAPTFASQLRASIAVESRRARGVTA